MGSGFGSLDLSYSLEVHGRCKYAKVEPESTHHAMFQGGVNIQLQECGFGNVLQLVATLLSLGNMIFQNMYKEFPISSLVLILTYSSISTADFISSA